MAIELPILKYFEYGHLPEPMRSVSAKYHNMAHSLAVNFDPDDDIAELVTAMRKLLESKDAAVRSVLGRGKSD